MLVSAPDTVREKYRGLTTAKMLAQRVLVLETQANTLEAHFGLRPTVISRIERGLQRDNTFADTHRNWLKAA